MANERIITVMEDTSKLTTLGRYRLVRQIGRGGMGEVWLAEDPHLLRQVALKVLPTRKRDDEEFLLRFEREARAAAALHHPHILPVHDYGQQQLPENQAITYLVMSYVSGGSVEDRLKTVANGEGVLTQDIALLYLFQVAEAIDYAHSHNIIHRDIKPGNMLLRDDNWLLLTDFGIARILTDADAFATGAYLGTPTYMAPEQAQGQAVPASDIYSLAVVAYQLFTGRVPFQADNPFALSFQHAFTPPTSPRVYNPTLSPEFEAALLRGLEKDPAQRPRSATAYVTALDQALKLYQPHLLTPVSPSPPLEQPEPVVNKTRRRILLGAGVGAGILVLGAAGAEYLARSLAPRPSTPATPRTRMKPTSTADAPLVISTAFLKPATSMAWSPVKKTLVTWSQDNQLILWDLSAASQSSPPAQLARLNPGIGSNDGMPLGWSPDGKMLAVGNADFDGHASAYETLLYKADLSGLVPSFTDQTLLDSPEAVQGVTWLTNTLLALVSSVKGDATSTHLGVWNLTRPGHPPLTATITSELHLADSSGINIAAASPDGSHLALGTSNNLLIGRLNTSGAGPLWQQVGAPLNLNDTNEVGEVGWSPDGRYVAAALYNPSANAVVGLWDASRQFQPVLPSLAISRVPAQIRHLAWSPTRSNTLLALGGSDGRVYLWDVKSGPDPERILSNNIQGQITALAWSFDGHWLAASYDDDSTTILLWRI